jgi:hypothetical protein
MRIRFAQAARMTRTIRLAILLFLLIPIAAFSQSGIWGMRGISQRFLVDGNYVVAVDGQGFSVYDVGTPGAVRRLSQLQTEGESIDGSIVGNDLVISTRSAIERYTIRADGSIVQTMHAPIAGVSMIAWNGHLLAGRTPIGIQIWRPAADGTLPNASQYPTNSTIKSFAWKGDTLFVAFADIGIKAIDGNTSVDISYIPEPSRSLAISGNTLYSASGGDGVAVIDISNPAAPVILGRTLAGSLNLQNISVAGTRVFAEEPPNVIHIIDASSATAPHEVATLTEPAQAMAVNGDRLLLSGPSLTTFGDVADPGNPLRVFDVANPAAPRLSAEVNDAPAASLAGVATTGSLAYVSDPPFFRVLDISITQAPRQIASLRIDGLQPHIKALGTQAVAYGTGDVQLIDLSDIYHPRLVRTFHSLGHTPSIADFVATGILEGNSFTGLHLVDFFNYPQPAIVSSFKIHPGDVIANGGAYAYINLGTLFWVISFPAPNTAINVRTVQIEMLGMAFAPATNNHPDLLIIRGVNAMHVFSLADPVNPIEIGSVPFTTDAPTLAASGDSVWIGTPGSLTRMDITDPTSPFIEMTTMQVTAPQQIAAANGKVVVADRYSIRVFGPNTPAPPAPPPTRRHGVTQR